MYRGNTVGVILPAYNEAEHLGSVIESLPAFVDRVYAIDDCSTDDTWAVICEYAAERPDPVATPTTPAAGEAAVLPDGDGRDHPTIVPVQHDENRGAGGTLKTGYQLARRDGMDATVTIDADGQMDPGQMARLLDPLAEGRAEFAKGNRLAADAGSGMPPFRLLGNWLLTLLMKPASGYWRLRDPQNGYTAIAHEALSTIDVDAIPADHDYPNDLITRLNAASFRIADVSMDPIYGDEESTIEFGEFVRRTSTTILASFVWRLRMAAKRGRPHLPACYSIGVVGLTLGAVAVVWTAIQQSSLALTGLAGSIATVPLVGGVAALTLALGVDESSDAEVVQG